jgi:tetratricopeptide (TPR) repeat protein
VTWIVRQGNQIMWRSKSESDGLATIELPKLAAGAYQLEAFTSNESRNTDLTIPAIAGATAKTTLVSFNANLAPARRLAFLGHQWLLRGDFERARQCLTASIAKGDTPEARIELARTSAMSGNLDGARDQVRGILTARPNDFEALSVFAYIETKFQDYPVAAELYRRALAVQDSPALRMALAKLPTQ